MGSLRDKQGKKGSWALTPWAQPEDVEVELLLDLPFGCALEGGERVVACAVRQGIDAAELLQAVCDG